MVIILRKNMVLNFRTVFPHSMSHGVLNKRPMVRIVVKAPRSTSSSPGKLTLYPLNTTLGGIVVIFIMLHGTLVVPHGTLSGECKYPMGIYSLFRQLSMSFFHIVTQLRGGH